MYQKVMVPLDGSELAECVLPHVEAIAKGCNTKNIIFLQIVEPFQPRGGTGHIFGEGDAERINAERKAAAEKYLAKMLSQVKYEGVNVESEIISGKPAAEGIADYVTKNGVDLVIIATHGRSGISRWVLGSVADRILRSSCVPVLMVRAPGCAPGI